MVALLIPVAQDEPLELDPLAVVGPLCTPALADGGCFTPELTVEDPQPAAAGGAARAPMSAAAASESTL